MNKRIQAAEAYLLSMRTGEIPAVEEAGKVLADDVKLTGALAYGRQVGTIEGKTSVLHRISGEWPSTRIYQKGFWSEPKEEGDLVKVTSTYVGVGGAPEAVNLTFHFNSEDKISQVDQETIPQARPEETHEIPDTARSLINNALRNNTPMTVAYMDEDGTPSLSLRGSVQVYSPTQLCIWVRNKTGGMGKALIKNPNIGLLYRDSNTRSTLVIKGKAYQDETPEVCDRVWNMIQDVEQKHDTREPGCALIIDLISIVGSTPRGGVRFVGKA